MKTLRIVMISDTHNRHHTMKIPDGDILIHAGDFSMQGHLPEVSRFNEWLGTLPHKHKIVIAGNHERTFDTLNPTYNPSTKAWLTNCIYLEHQSTVVSVGPDGPSLKIFGSPYSPEFMSWAFANKSPGQAENRWKDIPNDTDIVVVHGPPHGFGDKLVSGKNIGCRELFKRIMEIKPELVVSGHIHCGRGIRTFEGVTFVNAACVDEMYEPTQEALVYDWEFVEEKKDGE